MSGQMSRNIKDLYGLDSVASTDCWDHFKINSSPLDPAYEVPSERLIGIEVEVENHSPLHTSTSGIWSREVDGSLRNNGTEYISNPIEARCAPYAIRELLGECLNKEVCCFGPRTSIHIHVNAQDLTEKQIINATLLYSVVEPLLYKFTGRNRIKNIYCVPVSDTNLLIALMATSLNRVARNWPKYSGLNLLPLVSKGTLEFRHMHGTFDYNKVSVWVRMITRIVDISKSLDDTKLSLKILNLNASNYNSFLKEIFEDDSEHLKYKDWEEVENVVGNVYQAFLSPSDLNSIRVGISPSSKYFNGAL